MDNCHYTYLTSEAVTEGHPDKICDQISDAIVDAYLNQDPLSHVAVESFVSGNVLTLAGEVSSNATVDVTDIARKVIEEIGYTDPDIGFTADSCLVFTNITNNRRISVKALLLAATMIILLAAVTRESCMGMPQMKRKIICPLRLIWLKVSFIS